MEKDCKQGFIDTEHLKEEDELTKHSPFVSIIIPTYNRAYCIMRAIESVLNQTYTNFELLIVDDGSCDNTEEVVKSIADKRINYLRTPQNKGAGAARNYGVNHAKGELIAFQDSDDEWYPEKLRLEVDKLLAEDCGLVFGRFCLANESMNVIPAETVTQIAQMMNGEHGMAYQLLMGNKIGAPVMLIRKDLYLECGGFDESMKSQEDWDLAIRLAGRTKIGFVDKILMTANSNSEGINQILGQGRIEAFTILLGKHLHNFSDKNVFQYLTSLVLNEISSQSKFRQKEYYDLLLRTLKKSKDGQIKEGVYHRRPQTPILSIVVPVFTGERDFIRCLDSILQQPMTDLEVVCVNCGAENRTLAILHEFEQMDKRIRVIENQNGSFGDNMNQGIQSARGDYIAFVENGDSVCESAFVKLCVLGLIFDTDIVRGSFKINYDQENRKEINHDLDSFPEFKVINIKDNPRLLYCAPMISSGIYSRRFLLEKSLFSLNLSEENHQYLSFAFKSFFGSDRIVLTKEPIIEYSLENFTFSHNQKQSLFDISEELDEIASILQGEKQKDYYSKLLEMKYINCVRISNGLDVSLKIRFWISVCNEFHVMAQKISLEEMMHVSRSISGICKLLLDTQGYCTQWYNEISGNIDKIAEMLRAAPDIYVYGAGIRGKRIVHGLKKIGISPDAFLVSDKSKNEKEYEGIPVISVEESNSQGMILLGVSNQYREDVCDTLRSKGYYNYLDAPGVLL